MADQTKATPVVGCVDTHKDLHVAAVVDHRDRVVDVESFPTTRHGYRLMRAFRDLQRGGIEDSGSCGAGLLRYMQAAGVEVLEVTAPDKQDRPRRLSRPRRDVPEDERGDQETGNQNTPVAQHQAAAA